jgi:hypothetical protein
MDIVQVILNLDRRIIYTLVALLVAIPLIWPLSLPIIATPEVEGIYDVINNLEPGSDVLISADFDPASKPELFPMLNALLAHCFEREVQPHLLTLWPSGPGLMQLAVENQAKIYNKQSGKDYCFLGFKYGTVAVILGLAGSVSDTFITDFYGSPTAPMPLYQDVQRLSDFDYIIDIAAGATVEYWVVYGSEPSSIPIGASCTAVSAADYYPLLQAGQITGLAGGMKGTAEYEVLLARDYPNIQGDPQRPRPIGVATAGMDAQSAVHLFIVFSIIIANICFFIATKREREERRAS